MLRLADAESPARVPGGAPHRRDRLIRPSLLPEPRAGMRNVLAVVARPLLRLALPRERHEHLLHEFDIGPELEPHLAGIALADAARIGAPENLEQLVKLGSLSHPRAVLSCRHPFRTPVFFSSPM